MITRSIRILAQPLLRSRSNIKMLQSIRKSTFTSTPYTYRDLPPRSPEWTYYAADGCNAFMWWWIFVHCYYQFGHLVGEYDYPVPEKWSDAELGVVDE